MKKKEEFKCRWVHCLHGGTVKAEEAVRVGNMYFHKDCLEEKKNLMKIVDLYLERVDPRPIFAVLRKTINDIVFKDGFGADYFLFALNYCLDAGWNLKHVHGLRYVVRDPEAEAAWNRHLMVGVKKEVEREREEFIKDTNFAEFDLDNIPASSTTKRKNGFASILE